MARLGRDTAAKSCRRRGEGLWGTHSAPGVMEEQRGQGDSSAVRHRWEVRPEAGARRAGPCGPQEGLGRENMELDLSLRRIPLVAAGGLEQSGGSGGGEKWWDAGVSCK